MLGSTLLDRYRIDVRLGSRGMGTVYRAYDSHLEWDVAIKVLSNEDLGSLALCHGDIALARPRLEEAIHLFAQAGMPNLMILYGLVTSYRPGHEYGRSHYVCF